MLYDHKRVLASVAVVFLAFVAFNGWAEPTRLPWPMRIERIVTSSFGEFREGHVHAGLDLSTGGREGIPVYAVGDGYIERLRCSPFGYGKAIYLKLADGRTAVYAHLSNYVSSLRKRITDAQTRSLKYETDIWLPKNALPVKKGDKLGYSGSTGTSAPHLHFEIRGRNGCPLNPFEFYSVPSDVTPPVINAVAVVPFDENARVDGMPIPAVVPVKFDLRRNRYVAQRPVRATGRVGIAVETFDRGGKGPYKRGVNLIEVYEAGTPLFMARNDRFCYERGRQIYLSYVFSILRRNGRRFLKAYRDVGNTLSSYNEFDDGDGTLDIGTVKRQFTVDVTDDAGNRSELEIEIVPDEQSPSDNTDLALFDEYQSNIDNETDSIECTTEFWPGAAVFNFKLKKPFTGHPPVVAVETATGETIAVSVRPLQAGRYIGYVTLDKRFDGTWRLRAAGRDSGGRVHVRSWPYTTVRVTPNSGGAIVSKDGIAEAVLPPHGVYRPLYGRVETTTDVKCNGDGTVVGHTYSFSPTDQPLSDQCDISIKSPTGESTDKLAIYKRVNGSGRWQFLSIYGTSAHVFELGSFALLRDEHGPEINIKSPVAGSTVPRGPVRIKVDVIDEPAGINLDSVVTRIDEHPIVCEYHPPTRTLRYILDKPLSAGLHTFRVTIRDNVANETSRIAKFSVAK